MSNATKSVIFIITAVIVFSGCETISKINPFDNDKQKISTTPAEHQKAVLLKKIDKDFDNAQAHYELAELYMEDGLYSKAEYEYNLALGFDPVHRQAQAGMVNSLLKIGDRQKAEFTADMYITHSSNSAEQSLLLALAFQKKQLDDYALRCYKQALRLAPDSAKITRQIGFYHLTRENTTEAKNYLQRSFQLNPGQPDVANQLGKLGVEVRIPRNRANAQKLDKTIENYDRNRRQQQLKAQQKAYNQN
jgi:tetratricopeptide (TPR) repeat protein